MKIYVEAGSVKENYLISPARTILSAKNFPGTPTIYFSFIDDHHYGYLISTEEIGTTGLYAGQFVNELGPVALFADLLSSEKDKVAAAQAALADTQAQFTARVQNERIDTMYKMLSVRTAVEIKNLRFSLPLFSNIINRLESGNTSGGSRPGRSTGAA